MRVAPGHSKIGCNLLCWQANVSAAGIANAVNYYSVYLYLCA
ncbi:MAG: hypothetical protein OFPI_12080 [Osedax symbiont Rs2]|nr:MAG: hypothetical protein OFPI_12080 [Osedax symbiont Rs2]